MNAFPYQIAIEIKEFYEDSLFKNDNLGHLSIVEVLDKKKGKTNLYKIEAGVYDLEIQNKELTVEFTETPINQKVPEYLEVPESIKNKNDQAELASVSSNDFTNKIDISIVLSDKFFTQSYNYEIRPLEGGFSVMHYNYNDAGTIGTKIKLKGSEKKFIISNWHILAGSNGRVNDLIVQPGPMDGGSKNTHSIGSLAWYRLDNYMDAAIALIDENITLNSGTKCFSEINKIIPPKIGMDVKKCGRTTEETNGKILDTKYTARVFDQEYPNGSLIFKNQIKITNISKKGDSGSVIVKKETNNAIGLLFAGDNNRYSLANYLNLNKSFENIQYSDNIESIESPEIDSF